jgi:hypothetical protein
MKLVSIATTLLLGATADAASHNVARNNAHAHIARGHVHNARSPLFEFKDVLADRAIAPTACDKGALMNKLLTIVPTSLVSAMDAQATPFKNDSPPEFWSKLDDHEKECMAALWPKAGAQSTGAPAPASSSEPCTDTTVTSTLTQTSIITMSDAPSSSKDVSVPVVTSTAPAASSSASWKSNTSAPSSTSCTESTTTVTSTITQTFFSTSTAPVGASSSSGYATAPYTNGTTSTQATSSGTGVPSSTSPGLPNFTGGQDMLSASFVSSAMAAGVAVAFVVFA